jgi:thiol-disulfide isomerase/thioredoxin
MLRLFSVMMLAALATVSAGPLSGRRAPSFALPDSAMKYFDILDFRGKVVLVDIMQTTCPHCLALSKTLEQVKAKYGAKIQVLSIVTPPDNAQTVATFVGQTKVSSPILFDCGQVAAVYLKVGPQNPSVDVPHLFFIDPQGTIQEDAGGEKASNMTPAAIGAIIDRLLSGAAAPPAKK